MTQHLLNLMLHAQEQSSNIDRHQFVKIFDRVFMQRLLWRIYLGIIEGTIELSKLLDDSLHQCLNLGFVRDI